MKDTKLKLKVVQKGTHIVPFAKLNDDVPSPCECVAEALSDLEYRINELVKIGGYNPNKIGAMSLNAYAFDNLISSVKMLNSSLNAATKQDWKLALEEDIEHDMKSAPVQDCNCYTCECARAAKQ